MTLTSGVSGSCLVMEIVSNPSASSAPVTSTSSAIVKDLEKDLLAAITNQGRMLVFPLTELPQLAKGKGNKIINIPKANFDSDFNMAIDEASLGGTGLAYNATTNTLSIDSAELENYFKGDIDARNISVMNNFKLFKGNRVIFKNQF